MRVDFTKLARNPAPSITQSRMFQEWADAQEKRGYRYYSVTAFDQTTGNSADFQITCRSFPRVWQSRIESAARNIFYEKFHHAPESIGLTIDGIPRDKVETGRMLIIEGVRDGA